jgi:hypothetical protein
LTEDCIHRRNVSGSHRPRRGQERFTLAARILVENKDRKDVAEEKARCDQSNATEDIQPARTHYPKSGRESRVLAK